MEVCPPVSTAKILSVTVTPPGIPGSTVPPTLPNIEVLLVPQL